MTLTRLVVALTGFVLPLTLANVADATAHHRNGLPGQVMTATYHLPRVHRGIHQAKAAHHIPAYYAQ